MRSAFNATIVHAMGSFKFTIAATGLDPRAPDLADRFHGAGCDDALVGFQNGMTVIDFGREAESIAQAVASAVHDVSAAGAAILRIEFPQAIRDAHRANALPSEDPIVASINAAETRDDFAEKLLALQGTVHRDVDLEG